MPCLFPATRAAALERLAAFLESAPLYAAERNYVRPGHPNVSRLSPAIRHRLLTEEEVVRATVARHPFRAVEKFLQETLWRGYWKGWLERHPQVWRDYLAACREITADPEQCAVAGGRSGCGIMDAFARELEETGYLHNHARMWWASFWIHHRGLPWQAGARHFFDRLLDADPASNTLSWRWVAGLQTPGKTYLATDENIRKYCAPELLHAAGGAALGRPPRPPRAVPCGAAAEPPRNTREEPAQDWREMGGPGGLRDFREPVALLLHDEDMSVETGPLASLKPVLIAHLAPGAASPGTPRAAWLETARADAAERARGWFGCEAARCETAEEAAEKAAAAGARVLVMAGLFTGPLDDLLRAAQPALRAMGIRIASVPRPWDVALAPHAARGFFPFWKKAGAAIEKGGADGLLRL